MSISESQISWNHNSCLLYKRRSVRRRYIPTSDLYVYNDCIQRLYVYNDMYTTIDMYITCIQRHVYNDSVHQVAASSYISNMH